MELPIYEILAEENGFLYRVSLVETPAIDHVGVFFNEENEEVKFQADEEKRLLYAPALIPNKMIYRKDVKGSPANTFYSAETIEKLNDSYFKNICNAETNVRHEAEATEGIYPTESWIVKDPECDKAKALGFNVPAGTLMMCHKITNDQIWNEIKSGDLKGLSAEMFIKYELKQPEKMEKEERKGFIAEIVEAVKHAFEPKKEEEKEEVEAETQEVETDTAEVDALKEENEMLKSQLKEATDKLAEYEVKNDETSQKSALMEKEIEDLKSKVAFNAQIPKVPEVKKSYAEMTPLERAKNMYK